MKVVGPMFFLLSNVDEDIPSTAIAALNECHTIAFPILHRLLAVLAVLPISNAESERIFSKVERTLTALRSTMRGSPGVSHPPSSSS